MNATAAAAPAPHAEIPASRTGATRVLNLRTNDQLYFTLPPEKAVLAAYAQFPDGLLVDGHPARIRDANSWAYESRYGHRVEKGLRTYTCGDWCALQRPLGPAAPTELP